MKKLNILTNSSVKCGRRCKREFYWRYIREIRSTGESKALTGGSYCHGHWSGVWGGKFESDKYRDRLDLFERARLDAVLTGYDARWQNWIDEHVQTIKVEHVLFIPLVNPDTGAPSTFWQVGMKLDVVVLVDGRLTLVEHKSTSKPIGVGSSYFERLRIDSQISTYDRALRTIGYDDFDILYDVARKPQLRPLHRSAEIKLKKDGTPCANQRLEDETPDEFQARCLGAIAENPDDYYAHFQVTRLEDEVRESAQDMWHTAAELRESMLKNRWPRTDDACERFNSWCEFWPICSGVCGPDDSRYEHKPAHEELL